MPLARNKIILNGGGGGGNNAVIGGNAKGLKKVYENAEFLADELETNGWLKEPDALKFKERMEGLCTPFHATQKAYQKAQLDHKDGVEALVEDMRNYIDKKLLQP